MHYIVYLGKNNTHVTLFRNKSFMLDEMTWRNASEFALFLEYEKPYVLFIFHFMLYFIIFPNEGSGLCQLSSIDMANLKHFTRSFHQA